MRKILSRIRSKLLIAFAAVVTLPLVIVAIYSTSKTLRELDLSALASAADAAQRAARRVDAALATAQMDVLDFGQNQSLPPLLAEPRSSGQSDPGRLRAERQLRVLMETSPVYRRALCADRKGRVVLRYPIGERTMTGEWYPAADSVKETTFFQEAAGLLAGEVRVTIEPEVAEITFAAQVFVKRHQAIGVVALTFTPEGLLSGPGPVDGGGRAALLDRNGKPIWSSHARTGSLADEEREIVLGDLGGAFHRGEGLILGYARVTPSHDDPESWILVREVPEADLTDRVRTFRGVFAAVLVGALLLALVLSLHLSRQLTGPLHTLEEGAKRMAAGDLETEVVVESEDEIQDLAGEFNTMARQLRELTGGLERKVAEKVAERERLEVQLLQSERLSSIGMLAAGVAHEIHNPLAAISMYAQMLKEKADGPDQREKLKIILEHIDRISEITRGLLDFSRQRDGEFGPVDLHETLAATLRLVQPELDRQGVQTDLQRCPDLPAVRAQGQQLQQALLNIVMNASQAMPQGGTLTVSTRLLAKEGKAEVVIQDTGSGIGKKDLGRVFDPFFTTKEPGTGTGLGMAVTYGIVQSHQGQIEVDSKPERGTRVTIRLPLSEGGWG